MARSKESADRMPRTLKMRAGLAPVRLELQYPRPTVSASEHRVRLQACGSRRLPARSASTAILGASGNRTFPSPPRGTNSIIIAQGAQRKCTGCGGPLDASTKQWRPHIWACRTAARPDRGAPPTPPPRSQVLPVSPHGSCTVCTTTGNPPSRTPTFLHLTARSVCLPSPRHLPAIISATPACPASLATCSAVLPFASHAFQSTLAPLASSSRTTPAFPAAAARCAAVFPAPHRAFGSAPASNNSRAVRVWLVWWKWYV